MKYELYYRLSIWSSDSCWRGLEIITGDRYAWEYNEKNDEQKLNKCVKPKSEVGKELIKKIPAHWTQSVLM